MHLGMQRFHPAIHHLRKSGEVRHVLHFQSGVGEGLARAAGRHQRHAACTERTGEIDQPGLVGNGNQGAGDGTKAVGHGFFDG